MDKHKLEVETEDAGARLDKFLAAKFPGRTRHYIQKIIDEGCVKVNHKLPKSSLKLKGGENIQVIFPMPKELKLKAKKIPLKIVFENKDVIVINKPAGMVVHPGTGGSHMEDSLVNAILHHAKGQLSGISGVMRPGIVHRLDKDTSGLIVIAKSDKAHQDLTQQFKDRKVEKTYFALLCGKLQPMKGSIDAPIGRDRRDRKKMAVTGLDEGRAAVTRYNVLRYFGDYTYVQVQLITGRTHQIRVHFATIGYPLVGDPIYGKIRVNKFFVREYGLTRLFLHAGKLVIDVPGLKGTAKRKTFEAPLPADLNNTLKLLA